MEAELGLERWVLHNGAGVASLLAALADQERARIFALKHLLSLRPAHFANKPVRLILMRQVFLVSFQDVCAGEEKKKIAISVPAPGQSFCLMMKSEALPPPRDTHSSRLSLCVPSQSLMRFCRTPL